MMENSITNENGKVPASANNEYENSSSGNMHKPSAFTFFDGDLEEDTFDSLLDFASSFAELDEFHQSVAQGIPETGSNCRDFSMDTDSFQNPQVDLSSNTVSTSLQGGSLLPDWNMSWGQKYVNQGHNAISAGGISTFGGESSFVSLHRPQGNRDVNGSSFLVRSKESTPVRTPNDAGFNQSRRGIQGNFEGSFLSLGTGGTGLQVAASNELQMAHARKATSQTFDAGSLGLQSNNSGFSDQFGLENRMTSTNNKVGYNNNLNSWPDSSLQRILDMQQSDMQHDRNIRSGDLGHFRDEKVQEALSTELNMIHARRATGQTSGQSLSAGFMGFHNTTSDFCNKFSYLERMNSFNNEGGVLGTLNSGLGTSPHCNVQMQQNYSSNLRSGDLDRYRAFIGNQPLRSGNIGGSPAQVINSQQHNTPSEQLQYMHSSTANRPSYAGEAISQNATPTQVFGSNMFSQRTAGINAPFPKRLGVEFNVRNSLQTNQRQLSPIGTSLQTTSTGQVCQLPDKGLTRPENHVYWPSIGGTGGAPVINSPQPIFNLGQSQNALSHLSKGPQGAPANASAINGQSQTPSLHIRRPLKRSAVVPHPDSHWVQRQKIIHPTTIHHSLPKPLTPLTTAQIHPSIPVGSQTQPAGSVAAHIRPVVPSALSVKHRVPVKPPAAVSHITWKDPEATPKLSGSKCYLCKRDLALTSEGVVYQPTAPPPVAILPCGHSFHDRCLQNITPNDQAKDPPCIPCAIGEQ